jgi:nitrate reductase gamma subunit
MNADLFLTWVRSTGLSIATGIFVLGTLWRLFEIYSLGRKKDMAVPRHLAQHIKLIQELTGLSWPNLPAQFIDATAVVTLATMLLVLVERINKPVKRFLSTFKDYTAWTLTFLPVLTGLLATKHLLFSYTWMLALHILSAELLLIFIPFTNLIHVFTLWGSRWYNGDVNGKKGVPV